MKLYTGTKMKKEIERRKISNMSISLCTIWEHSYDEGSDSEAEPHKGKEEGKTQQN